MATGAINYFILILIGIIIGIIASLALYELYVFTMKLKMDLSFNKVGTIDLVMIR